LLRIRPFSPTDIPAVSEIVRTSLNEVYPSTLYLDIHRWWRAGFLVAELDGRPSGFLAGVLNAPQSARILMLAVQPEVRNLGIGTTLLNTFLRECAAHMVTAIELEVRKSNLHAIRFYERHAFRIAQDIPKFYTDGEDAWKMRRGLA
jgi:ribosomal protein S18 acetylase RimI-like enzyme